MCVQCVHAAVAVIINHEPLYRIFISDARLVAQLVFKFPLSLINAVIAAQSAASSFVSVRSFTRLRLNIVMLLLTAVKRFSFISAV